MKRAAKLSLLLWEKQTLSDTAAGTLGLHHPSPVFSNNYFFSASLIRSEFTLFDAVNLRHRTRNVYT